MTADLIPKLIQRLLDDEPADPAALEDALHEIMLGNVDAARTAGLLVALAGRRLDARTLAAAARAMRAHRVAVRATVRPLIDTCGTGGDGRGTFNISTATGLLLAAAGAAVAKHGNRGVSSKVGSADVLEAAGCELALTPDTASAMLDATGFAFLFAPAFHPAMAHVAPVRKSLAIRTVFNLLGPLTNPALAEHQLLGVYDPSLTETVATALLELDTAAAIVVHCAGLDEIGLHGITSGHRVRNGRVEPYRLDPAEFGLACPTLDPITGGDAATNLTLLQRSLTTTSGPAADIVALNGAVALELCGRVPDVRAGLETARELQSLGAGLRVLERYAESSARRARV